MSDFQQTITSLNLLHTSLYRMELFINAHAVKNAKADVISLISRLEKAECENVKLRERLSLVREQRDTELSKNTQLEAELARRDAAAGEPVAWLNDAYLGRGVLDGETGKEDQGPGYIPVYRIPPPAALSPEYHAAMKKLRNTLANCNRLNYCAEALQDVENSLVLGAQQKKVVELPAASVPHGWKLVPLKAFPSQWAAGQKAFDAAGINKIDPVYHAMVEAAPAPGGDGG